MQTSCTRYCEVSEDNDENHIILYQKNTDAMFALIIIHAYMFEESPSYRNVYL